MTRFSTASCLAAVFALAACNVGTEEAKTPPPGPAAGGDTQKPAEETMFDDHWTQTSPDDHGKPVLDPADVRDGRAAGRLTVDQLRRSIPRLFGDATWTVRVRGQDVPVFDALSRTLGEADYVQVTTPNTEPSPLFAKFMDDMAGQVCAKAIAADGMKSPGDRVVIPYADDVGRNLRFLRLKLHAIAVPDGSLEGLDDLQKLHADVLADTQSQDQAWTAVCVAMLTAPEMMAY